jgi:hypothetical protein
VRLFDTFLYSGLGTEPDLLECRLRELDGAGVDMHVIVEGDRTFQGDRKPLHWPIHDPRFKPWRARTCYVPHIPETGQPGKRPGDAWAREHSSRQAAYAALTGVGAEPGDVILHGDTDEIPSREAIASLREHADEITPCKLLARWAQFAVDWLAPPGRPWTAPSVMRYGQLDNFTALREVGWPLYPHCRPASWHLSWLGGREAMLAKVHAFSHTESVAEIEAGVLAGKYYERGLQWATEHHPEFQLRAVDVDETWPRWIWESWDPVNRCRRPEGPAPAAWFRPREA